MVSSACGVPMAIQVADCAPIVLICETPVIGIVHAGWRGLLAGIVKMHAQKWKAGRTPNDSCGWFLHIS